MTRRNGQALSPVADHVVPCRVTGFPVRLFFPGPLAITACGGSHSRVCVKNLAMCPNRCFGPMPTGICRAQQHSNDPALCSVLRIAHGRGIVTHNVFCLSA